MTYSPREKRWRSGHRKSFRVNLLIPLFFLLSFPIIYFFLGLLAFDTVEFLYATSQLLFVAFNFVQMVVGQFTPLLLDRAFELFPVAFNDVFVHPVSPLMF